VKPRKSAARRDRGSAFVARRQRELTVRACRTCSRGVDAGVAKEILEKLRNLGCSETALWAAYPICKGCCNRIAQHAANLVGAA
jgi:hypothetical protein